MNAIIISKSDKAFSTVVQVLKMCGDFSLVRSESALQARGIVSERRFDVAVIYAETREAQYRELAVTLATLGVGTVFIPAYGIEDPLVALYDFGIQLVGKPVTKLSLYSALKTATGLAIRMEKLAEENANLKNRILTLKAVCKAKCILVGRGMTENEAHKEIERISMETRRSRLETANEIIERNNGIQ